MRAKLRFLPWLAFLMLWFVQSTAALADKRVALVIGDSKYRGTAFLPNPANDAEDIAAALRAIGFDVIFKVNADKREMDESLARFARAAREADAALFFFAGHGMQHQGRNYIMPVDAELEDEVSLRYQMVSLDDVKAALDLSPGVKVMVLDACRNNPLAERFVRSIKSGSRDIPNIHGFVRPEQVRGMVVAYSTQANDTAQDGSGRNSPFTHAFVNQLKEPGLEIGSMFRRVAAEVFSETKGRQIPELSISLLSDYYLNQSETDRTIWTRIRASSDPATFREFIARFPNSFFAPDAKLRLDYLEHAYPEQKAAAESEKRKAEEQARQKALEAERAAREQAERERIASEAAAREKDLAAKLAAAEAERIRMANELAQREKDRAERDARDKAERLANEQAARLRSEEEKAATQKLLAEKEARDREAQAAAQQAQKLKAEVDRLQSEAKNAADEANAARAKAAAGAAAQAATAGASQSPAGLTAEQIALVPPIAAELKRIGCYPGGTSDWRSAAMQRSLKLMARYTGLATAPSQPDAALLERLKARQSRLCPLECAPRQQARGERCVAKTCGRGEILDAEGDCVARPVAKAKPTEARKPVARRPVERQERATARQAPRPVAESRPAPPRAAGGGRCFTFNGRNYCE
ncbi:MAG: caspase family protein [Hyphomicrobiales bacterium]|nr:caspase family protein [Hyphomicrobiales bacterium]